MSMIYFHARLKLNRIEENTIICAKDKSPSIRADLKSSFIIVTENTPPFMAQQ